MENQNVSSIEEKNGISIIHIQGRLDVGTAPSFDKFLKQLIGEGRNRLIVEMSGLEYISSAGIGVFVSCKQAASKQGGDVGIAGMQKNVYQVFDLLGFSKVFKIAEKTDQLLDKV